jgi:HEAT repeat protein
MNVYDSTQNFEERQQAEEAIRHIGTNAIPSLLRWISYDPSPEWDKVLLSLQKLPRALRPRFPESRRRLALETEIGFYLLGAQAAPAIPELTRLADTSSAELRAYLCSRALSHIGPDALPAMLSIISNHQCKGRHFPIPMLYEFHDEAQPAVPVLLKCLDDNNDVVAREAAETLGFLGFSNHIVVPVLAAHLQTTNITRRTGVIRALAEFGSDAQAAIPQLQRLLSDPASPTWHEARNALERIAPEVLTNAPTP